MCCSLLWVWAADKANRNKRQITVAVCLFCVQIFGTGFLGHTNRAGGSPERAGCFSLNLSGECADAARAHKRVDTCGFYPLNSRFTLFLSLAHTRDWRPLRNRGTAEDFYYRVFLNLFEGSDTLLLHIRFHQRKVRHSSAAQFVGTW